MFEAILLKAQPLLGFSPDFRRVRAETQERKKKQEEKGPNLLKRFRSSQTLNKYNPQLHPRTWGASFGNERSLNSESWPYLKNWNPYTESTSGREPIRFEISFSDHEQTNLFFVVGLKWCIDPCTVLVGLKNFLKPKSTKASNILNWLPINASWVFLSSVRHI